MNVYLYLIQKKKDFTTRTIFFSLGVRLPIDIKANKVTEQRDMFLVILLTLENLLYCNIWNHELTLSSRGFGFNYVTECLGILLLS